MLYFCNFIYSWLRGGLTAAGGPALVEASGQELLPPRLLLMETWAPRRAASVVLRVGSVGAASGRTAQAQ